MASGITSEEVDALRREAASMAETLASLSKELKTLLLGAAAQKLAIDALINAYTDVAKRMDALTEFIMAVSAMTRLNAQQLTERHRGLSPPSPAAPPPPPPVEGKQQRRDIEVA